MRKTRSGDRVIVDASSKCRNFHRLPGDRVIMRYDWGWSDNFNSVDVELPATFVVLQSLPDPRGAMGFPAETMFVGLLEKTGNVVVVRMYEEEVSQL